MTLWLTILTALSWGYRGVCRAALQQPVFGVDDSADTLVVGDSHPQSSLDPAVLVGVENVSGSGESLFFTFYKLRFLLDRNPGIRRVILGFSAHNLGRKYQDSLLFDESVYPEDFESYYTLLDARGKRLLRSWRRGFLVASLKYDFGVPIQFYRYRPATKILLGQEVRRADFDWVGGFYGSARSKLDDEQIRRKIKLYFLDERGRYTGVSDLMVQSLRSILALCRDRGIQAWVYTGPEHVRFRSRVPGEALSSFEAVRAATALEFPGTWWLDFSEHSLMDGGFGDGDHANTVGARIISAQVRDRLAGSGYGPQRTTEKR